MCYYLLPHISKNLKFDDVSIVFSDENTNNICKTSYSYLTTLKKEIEHLIYISSDAVYEDYKNLISENSITNPDNLLEEYVVSRNGKFTLENEIIAGNYLGFSGKKISTILPINY